MALPGQRVLIQIEPKVIMFVPALTHQYCFFRGFVIRLPESKNLHAMMDRFNLTHRTIVGGANVIFASAS